MLEAFTEFFRQLADDYPRWNFIFFHEPRQWARIVKGLQHTVVLSITCVLFSVIIGVVGAWMQSSPSVWVRRIVQGYIQFFRNTPPFVQLLFFYFALGQFTPAVTAPDGWTQIPLISNIGWAIISLSFFAGAFNVEIFRSGIEAVPESTQEAASALGFTRLQTYKEIVLPLAFRVSLPALNNNLVNLVKTTTQAIAIAVPELLYQSVSIWSDYPSAQYPTMILLFFSFIFLVGILVWGMSRWERTMRIPGYAG
ncbi:MAG: amino acid ABC transporter permease [Granulosicoccus sp.]